MIKIHRRNKGQKCLFKHGDEIITTNVEIPKEHRGLLVGSWFAEEVIFDCGVEKIRICGQYYPAHYFVKV